MKSNLSEFEEEPVTRSTLLNVLCILTFIGSGWAILSNIGAYILAPKSARMVSYRDNVSIDSLNKNDSVAYNNHTGKRSKFGEKMMLSFSKVLTEENIKKNAIAAIISGIFTLIGAVLMWRLNRLGFYLYIIGIIIGIVVPFYLYGNNLVAVGISAFSSFFGLVFIALYSLNFKNFRK